MYIVPKTVSAGLLLSGAATSAQARMPEAPQKPNIVYIIADQLRWDALGYTGNAKAVTPNIDRFAAQRFRKRPRGLRPIKRECRESRQQFPLL